ncbi:MAG: Ig-like domain-containing protein [bacterium]|nr:Ig-like domain-containing protein [bacterium]
MRCRLFSFLLFLALLVAGFGLADFALAQNVDIGLQPIENSIQLASTDPRIIVARIINIALLFLGVIAVGLIIYAGFIWMTSGGSEEKIDQAKKTLRNAVIGLIIILSAWGIATFVLNRLLGATNGGFFGINTPNQPLLTGAGAIGACTVERVYPEDGQRGVARNTSIMVSFKEAIMLDTVCQDAAGSSCACSTSCNLINPSNIKIFRNDMGDGVQNVTAATIQASADSQDFVIMPTDFLGQAEGDVDYSVRLTSGIKKEDGNSIFKTCFSDYLQWSFRVTNTIDLTPPQIVRGGIFPLPDNEKDIFGQSQAAVNASAAIQVQACPDIYQAAEIISVTRQAGLNDASAVIASDYHASYNNYVVSVTSDNTQAQLFTGSTLLGVTAWQGNEAVFGGFFTLLADDHQAGNSWVVSVAPEVLASNLRVGTLVYTFASNSSGNNILVNGPSCNTEDVATEIYSKLSGHPDINVDKVASRVALTVKIAGSAGNNIILNTNNAAALALTPFNGGQDLVRIEESRDKKDRPMNSVIQINFNEGINPIQLSGSADEVSNSIRIVNAESSTGNGAVCTSNSGCASYDCNAGVCRGDYLAGKFMVSNAYKTVEFISDKECGMNGCGETIYCLPANSHLAVQLVAANLRTCETNFDCTRYQPFTLCQANSLGQNICQDPNGKNYPLALSPLDGVVDAALNSLDGNRDVYADGPIAFYNENDSSNFELKDKYRWSFYINDTIMSEPPRITSINPVNSAGNVPVDAPIEIAFNTLMMNSSLRTGSTMVKSGQTNIEHRLLNIFSSTPNPLGYWVTADNRDVAPLDGEPDLTYVYLSHTPMKSSVTYNAQVGSGVKDIYQNCYKPSAGPNCEADAENPSCCYGVPSAMLGDNGNCE